ncbi:molybdenum cofactor guanylyltransferase [Sinimarinibacterium sp. CAU 1509]|uniref:molybdenum cofactor guanylyltransferase MobA n=1 Tax=Sinimarinibacterium sp. CAU 1509 TaxID=2562283 RepID=UPI0010AD7801|nr:molybdenum cofactor guanylyltransferase MobA [Sinimarinibacterium sp. CAU 1509]TJY58179.1 molybdenum cofactor guanylyltransferase [Sinimarinibacterium sp. CAU 1509]
MHKTSSQHPLSSAAVAPEQRVSPCGNGTVTGVILAGGQGARMGGRDKGLIEYKGRPLVEHQLELLRPQVGALMISANRNLDRYAVYGVPVVSDATPDFRGPLAGMLAALRAARTPWVVCVACDTLGLPGTLVECLLDSAKEENSSAAYVADASGAQYTVCALHTTLADPLDDALRHGRRAVREFLGAQRAARSLLAGTQLHNLNSLLPATETPSC